MARRGADSGSAEAAGNRACAGEELRTLALRHDLDVEDAAAQRGGVKQAAEGIDHEASDGEVRQAFIQRGPARAAVGGDEDAAVGGGIDSPRVSRFGDEGEDVSGHEARVGGRPAGSAVPALEDAAAAQTGVDRS